MTPNGDRTVEGRLESLIRIAVQAFSCLNLPDERWLSLAEQAVSKEISTLRQQGDPWAEEMARMLDRSVLASEVARWAAEHGKLHGESRGPLVKALSVEEVAQALGCNHQTVRKLIDDGQLQAIRVGRLIRIPTEALEHFLRDRRELESTKAQLEALLSYGPLEYIKLGLEQTERERTGHPIAQAELQRRQAAIEQEVERRRQEVHQWSMKMERLEDRVAELEEKLARAAVAARGE